MVRAILDGRKTQTRRIVRLPPKEPTIRGGREPVTLGGASVRDGRGEPVREFIALSSNTTGRIVACPYGDHGDRLWVREAWGLHAVGDETDWERGSVAGCPADEIASRYELARRADWGPLQEGCCWRPAIHMPRWASRITLEVTGVRVERLHDITEEDARAEGVEAMDGLLDEAEICRMAKVAGCGYEDARGWFAALWEHINGKRAPWASNPWLWVVLFRRAETL